MKKSGKPRKPAMLEDVILLDDLVAEKIKGGVRRLVFGERIEQLADPLSGCLPDQQRRAAPKSRERK